MAYHHHQSNSFISLRYCLVLLCISMIIIKVSQALNDDLLSSIENNNEQQLYRRDSKKILDMLHQMLQRGEMQVAPYRFHKFLGRLHRRRTNEQIKNAMANSI